MTGGVRNTLVMRKRTKREAEAGGDEVKLVLAGREGRQMTGQLQFR